MNVASLPVLKKVSPDSRKKAVVLLEKEPGSRRGTLLVHVEEQDERLVPGERILAIPVHVGQPGLEVALFASTLVFQCTQTIFLGGVMLSLSPELLHEVGAALHSFLKSASVP